MFLALGIMKVKCFPSSPSRVCEITEKEFYTLGFFRQIRYQLYFNDKNHVKPELVQMFVRQ